MFIKTLEELQREIARHLPEIQSGEISYTLTREGIAPQPAQPDVKNLLLQVRSLFESSLPAPIQYHLIFSAEEPILYFIAPRPDGKENFCMGDASPDEPLAKYLETQDWEAFLDLD